MWLIFVTWASLFGFRRFVDLSKMGLKLGDIQGGAVGTDGGCTRNLALIVSTLGNICVRDGKYGDSRLDIG
jgi:hypothetical protein